MDTVTDPILHFSIINRNFKSKMTISHFFHLKGLWEDIVTEWLNNISSSFHTRVYIANQQFSLTDQFRMGIRAFELDTHWYSN